MKGFVVLLALSSPFFSEAQRLHLDVYAGVSNYQGDLQDAVFTLKNSKPAFGIGLTYDLTNHFALRGSLNIAKVEGDDAQNKAGKGTELRNLNFKSNITEGNLALQYNILDISEYGFTPYVFVGAAVYKFNPYTTVDSSDAKIYLQPLRTEGQGLAEYPDRKPYKLTQFAIPFGGGIKLALTENIEAGFELGFRKLFHDYLDDVSTNYADPVILASNVSPLSADLAFRGDELPNGITFPGAGEQRGNPKLKDWYYITGLRLSFLLGNGNGGGRKSRGTGCPTNIY